MAKIIIDIPDEDYKELIKDKDFILRTNNPWKTAIVNGKALSDGATNGDVIKALFPSEVDFETDFDDDWWNASYKGAEHEVKICDTCAHYGEDLHGANCRFCSNQKLWEPKEE